MDMWSHKEQKMKIAKQTIWPASDLTIERKRSHVHRDRHGKSCLARQKPTSSISVKRRPKMKNDGGALASLEGRWILQNSATHTEWAEVISIEGHLTDSSWQNEFHEAGTDLKEGFLVRAIARPIFSNSDEFHIHLFTKNRVVEIGRMMRWGC